MTVPSLTFEEMLVPVAPQGFLAKLLSNAAILGLNVTSWQSGGVARSILALLANSLSNQDSLASLMFAGGFLDFAATGRVPFTNIDGTITLVPVTPDPSKPSENPTGALGWLDVLADNQFDELRILDTFAGGAEAIINTSASTYGPFAIGTYHVADPYNNATYSNVASLTITPSTVISTVIGVVASSGLIRIQTFGAHGLVDGDVVGIVGVTGITGLVDPTAWYVEVVDADKFKLLGSTFGGAYTGGGTVYDPTVATVQADTKGAASTSTDATGTPNVHTVTQAVTSLSGVSVDNLEIFSGSDIESNVSLARRCRLKLQWLSMRGPKGAYEYAALSAYFLAQELNPPETLSQPITREIEFVDKRTGIITVWIANASGAPNATDVRIVDDVEAAFAEATASTEITLAATNVSVAVVVEIWLPAAFNVPATTVLFQTALQLYFATLPIGGLTDPGGAYANVLPFTDVLGAIYEAAQTTQIQLDNVALTLNGGTVDIPLDLSDTLAEVASLSPAVPSVTLHSV